MASTSETGHTKNVAHFQDLIAYCQAYKEKYNPANPRLKLVELQKYYLAAKEKLQAVAAAKAAFDKATDERRIAFTDLKPLATRIVNSFAISGADAFSIDNAKSINKKLQGRRKTVSIDNSTEKTATHKRISTSQQSYDQLIDHFANLIEVLAQHTIYNPNEKELKVTSLKVKLQDLQAKNTQLINAYILYSNAMMNRNNTLYDPLTGLVKISRQVKQYIKSVFGAKSPQYQQIRTLEFKIIKK